MEVGQGPNWGCSAKGQKTNRVTKRIACNAKNNQR
jgi:hypothetical protein